MVVKSTSPIYSSHYLEYFYISNASGPRHLSRPHRLTKCESSITFSVKESYIALSLLLRQRKKFQRKKRKGFSGSYRGGTAPHTGWSRWATDGADAHSPLLRIKKCFPFVNGFNTSFLKKVPEYLVLNRF